MAFDLPILRKKLLPSIADALKAMKAADERDEKARDTRPLLAILMRIVEADPRLGGHVLTRRTALTSFDVLVEPIPGDARGNDDGAAETAARVRAVGDTVLNRAPERSLYGAVAIQVAWEAGELGVTPSVAYDYDPDEIARPSRRLEDLRLLSWTGSAKPTATALPVDGTVIAAIDESHWTGGVLRSVLIREILLNENLQEWARFTKKLKGIIGAKFEGDVPEAGDPEHVTATASLKGIVSDNYAMYSDRMSFEFNKVVEAAAGGSFKELKGDLEADVAIAILGQANTSELPAGGGSRAALQVLNLVRRDIHHSDIRTAEAMANELLLWDYRFNVDAAATSTPYRWRVALETDDDAGAQAEAGARAVSEAMDALEGTGVGLPTSEVFARLGFTMPEGAPTMLQRTRGTTPGLPPPDPDDDLDG
jgi:hypothetical protein